MIESRFDITNRWDRIQNLYVIRDKDRNLRKLKFNPSQVFIVEAVKKTLGANLPIRHMDLKARQVGASTFWSIFFLDDTLFNKNVITFIVAQQRETLGLLWDVVRLAYGNMPEKYRPEAIEDSARSLTFAGLNSTIKVSLKVLSTTIHNLHVSEYALCEQDEIEKTLAACGTNANIALETVAFGVNHACDKWNESDDGYTRLFHPWFKQPEYRLPVVGTLNRTELECAFAARTLKRYGVEINDGQLAWRRQRMRDIKGSFHELFAEDEESCFMVSGQTFFDVPKMKEFMQIAKLVHPVEEHNDWVMWEKPQPGQIYAAGADNARGPQSVSADPDYSVLSILNVTAGRTAFRYKARVGVDVFYRECDKWGRAYNNALLGVESNDCGSAVIMGLRELKYPKLYSPDADRPVNRPAIIMGTGKFHKSEQKFGWDTNAATKTPMLYKIKLGIEGQSDEDAEHCSPMLVMLDQEFFQETFNFRQDRNKLSAASGKHDDVIMANAIAFEMFLICKRSISILSPGAIILGEQSESSRLFG